MLAVFHKTTPPWACWHHLLTPANWNLWQLTKNFKSKPKEWENISKSCFATVETKSNPEIAFFTPVRLCHLNFVMIASWETTQDMQVITSPDSDNRFTCARHFGICNKTQLMKLETSSSERCDYKLDGFQASSNASRTCPRKSCRWDTRSLLNIQVSELSVTPGGMNM